MANMNYDETQIIRFLRNEMEPEDKEAFEDALKQSIELQREVAFHKQLMKGLDLNLREDTKSYLKDIEKGESINSNKSTVGLFSWLKVASLLLIILGSGLLIYMTFFQNPDSKALAKSHFKPYPNQLTNITRGNEGNNTQNYIDQAMLFYSSEKYGKAIPLFKKAIDQDKASGLAEFYLGNAYLAEGKTNKAIQSFKSSEENLPTEYKVKSEWYLALAYLSKDQEKDALLLINSICEKGNDFYCQKGQEIKKAIE